MLVREIVEVASLSEGARGRRQHGACTRMLGAKRRKPEPNEGAPLVLLPWSAMQGRAACDLKRGAARADGCATAFHA